MSYIIGQIFEENYPPEAAMWCGKNNATIEEIAPQDGVRRFQIKEIPAPTKDELFSTLRMERGALLLSMDYLLMSDYPLSEKARAAVVAYRQALRDLPAQEGAPWDGGGPNTPWPTKPEI